MITKIRHSKDGSFKIPSELAGASLLNHEGLSYVDMRITPHYLVVRYAMLQNLRNESQKVAAKKAGNGKT